MSPDWKRGGEPRRPGPWTRCVALPPPSLKDNTADTDRLLAALKKELGDGAVDVDIDLLKQLPLLLRKADYRIRCTVFRDRHRWVLTGIDAFDAPRPAAAVAVDLGTTRVVLQLMDLASGRVLGEHAFDNPQIAIGPDVLARIHHADSPGGLKELNRLIIGGLNTAVGQICRTAGIEPSDICAMSVAGNTSMTHLFLGLEPRWIIREPYIPVVNRPGVLKAADLGIQVGPFARVLVFPNIGSYFGGDLIAGILFSGLHRRRGHGDPGRRRHQRRSGPGQRALAHRLRRRGRPGARGRGHPDGHAGRPRRHRPGGDRPGQPPVRHAHH